MEEVARECVHTTQVVEGAQPRLLLCVALACGSLDAELLRLPQNRLKRGNVLDEREKFERIAARMAAEAVKKAL